MQTALVTAIGSFSADIVIKNLTKKGLRIIGCDIYRKELIADAYNVNKFYQAPLALEAGKYFAFIKELCINENVRFVLPLTDVEIDTLNNYREWFDENGILLCISPKNTIDMCRNKKSFADFAKKLSFIAPIPTQYVAELKSAPKEFPVICKPCNGRSSIGLRYIYSEEEWNEFILYNNTVDYIVQPCINGSVVTVDVVRHPVNNKGFAICREEMLRTQNGAGTSVYVFADEDIESKCVKLAEELNIVGCVNFEFIKDEAGNYHLMECNPRFSGGIEFSCMAGYDFIWNHLRCFFDREIAPTVTFRNMFIVRKYEEYITYIE